jgi:hypothetical protein
MLPIFSHILQHPLAQQLIGSHMICPTARFEPRKNILIDIHPQNTLRHVPNNRSIDFRTLCHSITYTQEQAANLASI